jgi:hypothetical protein
LNPRFFLAEALRSIRANAAVSIAATVTVLIAVFILGAFIPSFLYVQSTVDAQKERVDINVFISDSATVPQVEGLRSQLTALQEQGEIESFVYVSKDEALVKLRERLNDTSILEDLPGNPLPASFEVKPTDPARSDAIIAQLQDSPAIDTELGISYGKEAADRLLSVARFIQWAGLGLISILLVASILLIDLRPPPRGRGDEARGRDQLVHPLAVRHRGDHLRPDRRGPLRRAPVRGQGRRGRHLDPRRRQRPHPRPGDHDRLPAARPHPDRLGRPGRCARQRHHAAPLPQGLTRAGSRRASRRP